MWNLRPRQTRAPERAPLHDTRGIAISAGSHLFQLGDQMPHGKTALFINVDETSIAYTYTSQRGCMVSRHLQELNGIHFRERASLKDRRGGITFVAAIASDAAMQNMLPQVLIGNRYRFTKKLMRSVKDDIPPGVHVWTEDTASMTQTTFRRYLTIMNQALQPVLDTRQPFSSG